MDKSSLSIRVNGESNYKTFNALNTEMVLLDSQLAGNNKNHSIDIKLNGGLANEVDNYKATIKFEINQK